MIDDEGYPRYKRRDFVIHVDKQGVQLDNRYVVPYNPHLLIRYEGHVNVEYVTNPSPSSTLLNM